ncbi:MAG: S41 family peptidase [Gammaproteobacteria bacterium]|nr:S41 family peptidase [Gammaproteobacteria bacterium]
MGKFIKTLFVAGIMVAVQLCCNSSYALNFHPFTPHGLFGALPSGSINGFFPEPIIDLRNLGWTDAFDKMHATLQKEYAFTNYRNINWEELKQTIRPKILQAELNNNEIEYYTALREYIVALHETHTDLVYDYLNPEIANFVFQAVYHNIGGSYGLIVSKLDNGKFIASYVADGGAAQRAGIIAGAEIINWNNQPILSAINNTSLTWSSEYDLDGLPYHIYPVYAPSTQAGIQFQQLRLLVRASIKTPVNIVFQNPGSQTQITKTLIAQDDNQDTLKRTALYHDPDLDSHDDPSKAIKYQILPGDYGYIRVLSEVYEKDKGNREKIGYLTFKKAIDYLNQHGITKVIVDIRGNNGGDPELSCDFSGFFSHHSSFCTKLSAYQRATQKYDSLDGQLGPYYHGPQDSYFSGKVAVLTDIGTLCAGEILAAGFKELSALYPGRVRVFSIDSNTTGSISSQYMIAMPGNFGVEYSILRAYDENGNILIESKPDSSGKLEGGIAPDEKIPLTTENALDIYSYAKDIVLEKAESWLKN